MDLVLFQAAGLLIYKDAAMERFGSLEVEEGMAGRKGFVAMTFN
jgi:hypothetical protein